MMAQGRCMGMVIMHLSCRFKAKIQAPRRKKEGKYFLKVVTTLDISDLHQFLRCVEESEAGRNLCVLNTLLCVCGKTN